MSAKTPGRASSPARRLRAQACILCAWRRRTSTSTGPAHSSLLFIVLLLVVAAAATGLAATAPSQATAVPEPPPSATPTATPSPTPTPTRPSSAAEGLSAQFGYAPPFTRNVPAFDAAGAPYIRSRSADPDYTGFVNTLE